MSRQSFRWHLGIDENGLGAQLGPLIVTAVIADVSDAGQSVVCKKPQRQLAKDLDDSKKLVAFGKHGLSEAWTRALYPEATTPTELLNTIFRQTTEELQGRCPTASRAQCWTAAEPAFCAPFSAVLRLRKHISALEKRGVRLHGVLCEVVCTNQLNAEKKQGLNRFTSDLHAMERLILALQARVSAPISAVCGKVGGMSDYAKFFGPLGGRLHVCLEQARQRSAYHFPGLGELHFVQDADALHPLVMLASLVGKYVRESLMGNINRFYVQQLHPTPKEFKTCSGYNDPVTATFIQHTASVRKRLRIASSCFERD